MFGGALNEDAFKAIVCQQSRAGQGITARWAMQMLGVSKATALRILDDYVAKDLLTKTEISYRSNAKKFFFYPTEKVWADYKKKLFRAGYLTYMRAMMEA